MTFEAAWTALEEMLTSLISALPNLIVALLLLVLTYFLSRLSRHIRMDPLRPEPSAGRWRLWLPPLAPKSPNTGSTSRRKHHANI